MQFMTGKLDPVPLDGVGFITDYETADLPAVPGLVTPPSKILPYSWGMFDNDKFGNCTIAGAAHLDMAWDAEVAEKDTIPSVKEADKEYFSLSGGEDTGLVMSSVVTHWIKKGLFGYKVKAGAPVAETVIAMQQAIAFYGGLYVGVQLPMSAQSQFHQGHQSTWSVVSNSPIEGGHCIVGVGYNAEGMFIISWGQVVLATWSWIARYLDEAYVLVPNQFVEAKRGPSVLDLSALEADIKKL